MVPRPESRGQGGQYQEWQLLALLNDPHDSLELQTQWAYIPPRKGLRVVRTRRVPDHTYHPPSTGHRPGFTTNHKRNMKPLNLPRYTGLS